MAVNLMLILRGVQAALAVIILGLTAAVINDFTKWNIGSPDEINFLLFCSIWTFLVLAYICFAQKFVPQFHNQYGVVGAEVVTVIFWFAGWVATAARVAPWRNCLNVSICHTAKAAVAMGAFEWLAFMISAFLVIRAFMETRKGAGAATAGTEMPATTTV
ncbi:hypothetical protein BJ508DRAFT_12008 [Ascobolus immersus RN42]|uniref:MARVEL domain-containing protein n=1 Tax=Ascobolus immersus RN42 TaxID=1160509 RepID=A0A3N4HW26_ASCIM|nr:hypothetical protein BJ508DRAFT_12008 [Ascobolus immersus RN42]